MYSDIWYSFVRVNGQDREFMELGYKNPIRVLYDHDHCESDRWVTGDYPVFRTGRLQPQAEELALRIKLFHRELIRGIPEILGDPQERSRNNQPCLMVRVPRDRIRFAPVRFEYPPENPVRARFAVRREPWVSDPKTAFGMGYCGTAEVSQIDGETYNISPRLFSLADSLPEPARLYQNESIRFWLHFKSPDCLFFPSGRLGFWFQIESQPLLESFNAFFRVPVGYEALAGGITELRHYAVPPRLFFLWDNYLPEQCLAFNNTYKKRDVRIELTFGFRDNLAETTKLIHIFILGVLISLAASFSVETMLSAPDSIPEFFKSLHLDITGFLAVFMLGLSAMLVYQGNRLNLGLLFLAIVALLGCAWFWDGGPLWGIISVALVAFLFLEAHMLVPTVIRHVKPNIFYPALLQRLIQRRRFIKKWRKQYEKASQ